VVQKSDTPVLILQRTFAEGIAKLKQGYHCFRTTRYIGLHRYSQ